MAERYTIHVRCENGHHQTLSVEGWSRECAEQFAKTLDVTHSMFIHRLPEFGSGSQAEPILGQPRVGYCGICNTRIRAEVLD